MRDDEILAYLRARGQASPSLDLVGSIVDAVAVTPQQRHSWFAPLIPGVAVVGVSAVILATAIIIGQSPNVGPPPEQTTDPSVAPSAAATGTPLATAVQTGSDLLQPGSTVTMPVRSADGVTGIITIERGEDTGGYRLVPDPPGDSYFFIELLATYELELAPETAQWGDVDWRVEGEDGAAVGAELLQTFPAPEGRPSLGTWPGATVPEDRYSGWMIFAVPREPANTPLELVYQPNGIDEAVRFPLRNPGEAPAPVAADWPRPDPVYVSQDGSPITVLESAEADALFADEDTCTNPEGGYTVTFPEAWYTNTEIGDVPACSWFSPTFYEATAGGERPNEIAIDIRLIDGAIGFIWADLYSEEVTLDGTPARRAETGFTKAAETPTDRFEYTYLASLDDDPTDGRKLWAFTGTEYGGEYELNKAVLDRIMASLRFNQ